MDNLMIPSCRDLVALLAMGLVARNGLARAPRLNMATISRSISQWNLFEKFKQQVEASSRPATTCMDRMQISCIFHRN